jgi:hypothetical protein
MDPTESQPLVNFPGIQHVCENPGSCHCEVSDLFSYKRKGSAQMPPAKTNKNKRKASVTEVAIQDFNRKRMEKRKDLLGAMLLDKDLCSIVFSHLSVKELLHASMVCRSFMETIDAFKNSPFNCQLRWWGNFSSPWVKKLDTVTCGPDGTAYRQNILLDEVDVQYMWLLNVMPKKGSRVQMRTALNLTLDQVELKGPAKSVERIRDAKFISIEVLEWEIIKIQHQPTQDPQKFRGFDWVRRGLLADFRMRVISFVPSAFSIDAILTVPIIITFQNVPVLDEILTYRQLCVVRCMYNCMHCHQRARKWLSVDTKQTNHRVLCSLCFQTLYVEEKVMHRKYKCHLDGRMPGQRRTLTNAPPGNPSTLENLRVHYVEALFGINSRVLCKVPMVVMEKSKVAQHLGFSSWTEFLASNYRRPKSGVRSGLSPYIFCTQGNRW